MLVSVKVKATVATALLFSFYTYKTYLMSSYSSLRAGCPTTAHKQKYLRINGVEFSARKLLHNHIDKKFSTIYKRTSVETSSQYFLYNDCFQSLPKTSLYSM